MYKIATVVGARPQFIKAAVVSGPLRASCTECLIHTGQHYDHDLSATFFDELEIPEPDHHLSVGSASHAEQTANAMVRLEEVFRAEQPDLVLIYGDTNSTLAAALAAVKLCLPIAHVESGCRNHSFRVPEEINRIVADRFAALNFCATRSSIVNLANEGISKGVSFTGDVMLDLFLTMRDRVRASTAPPPRFSLTPGAYVLATLHRPRNTDIDERLKAILGAFLEIEEPLVLPLHPRTLKNIQRIGWYERISAAPHIHLTGPLGYMEFLRLQLDARMIVTDSGGVQREAYFGRTPCVTLFPNTTWPETVEDGWNVCVDADKDKLLEAVRTFAPTHQHSNAFGDGHAGEQIVESIIAYLDDPHEMYV